MVKYPILFGKYGDSLLGGMGSSIRMQTQITSVRSNPDEGSISDEHSELEEGLRTQLSRIKILVMGYEGIPMVKYIVDHSDILILRVTWAPPPLSPF